MDASLEPMDERTLFQAIRLGITSGANRMHFRPGCAPLCTWHGGEQQIRYRQLTGDDTEAIAALLLEHAYVPERLSGSSAEGAQMLRLWWELPGEALLEARLRREAGQLAIDVEIARAIRD